MTEEECAQLKVRLAHTVFSERTESEIVKLTNSTLHSRRIWIRESSPTANEILTQYPRFLDTPSLVNQLSCDMRL